ncbi:SLATT domain-containing protein [Streptomyces iconiensis]|uniref:SLATT domain-containing protein n=1 Tax=Streptomyces iconiensis TaxID=1384038 RepID=A0ABT7A067_9ACTN|nr:SLATT domain-containing protein [Streptomyces iconiensis]MDJ1134714.1 SLATT domain-containing protein [Streptomyces iconiensis]
MHQPDLLGRGFPSGSWEEPAERLEELYKWVEQEAVHVVEWYLADRTRKRRGARLLRLGAVTAATGGVLLPLLELAEVLPRSPWGSHAGYIALLCAAACLGADRWLGLTSGWMRDMAAAHAVHRRLEALRYEWAAENVREILGPAEGTAGEAAERLLAMLRRFTEDVGEIVRTETSDWMVEFRTTSSPLQLHAAHRGRTALAPPPARRLPPPPAPGGGRANMPRQRPPGG